MELEDFERAKKAKIYKKRYGKYLNEKKTVPKKVRKTEPLPTAPKIARAHRKYGQYLAYLDEARINSKPMIGEKPKYSKDE